MKASASVLIALIFVIATSLAQKCGQNEHFVQCGSHCPPTCENKVPEACIFSCKAGCFCNPGHLKNAQGECVPENKC
ncbi:unnamed protein product [Tenebrio molitor]|nr:unnamed protein product [Tenebrio molitor]